MIVSDWSVDNSTARYRGCASVTAPDLTPSRHKLNGYQERLMLPSAIPDLATSRIWGTRPGELDGLVAL
jgi:hypothetical protein